VKEDALRWRIEEVWVGEKVKTEPGLPTLCGADKEGVARELNTSIQFKPGFRFH
jgi:hypothetical protein